MERKFRHPVLQARMFYAAQLEERDCGELEAEYAVNLAEALFGQDTSCGKTFLQREDLWAEDPLKLAAEIYGRQGNVNKKLTAELVWKAQINTCLSLFEEERRAFISAEYGRLLPLLGVDYWNRETGTYGVLWHYDIGARIDEAAQDALRPQGKAIENPYELDLPALALLGYLDKRIEMLGTVSYTPFFRMRSQDRDRLVLLADGKERLLANQILAPAEMKKLLEGHEAFVKRDEAV